MENDRSLLGAWLIGIHLEDIKRFSPDDFEPANRKLFDLIKSGNSMVEIASKGSYKPSDLAVITDEYFSEAWYESVLSQEVKNKANRKMQKLSAASNLSYEVRSEELKKILEEVESLNENVHPEESLAERYGKELRERRESKHIKYGIPSLDEATEGIKRKELTVIGAMPSTGKSAFALQIASRCRYAGEKVLFFPLEMSTEQNIERLIVSEGITSSKWLRNGKVNQEESAKISRYLDNLESENLLQIYESKAAIETIEALARKEKPYLIIIDQLTQMKSKSREFRTDLEHHQYMTSNLKRIAMNYNVAIILLHQLNRTTDRSDPSMSSLKGSGSLEEDADNVILLQRMAKEKYKYPLTGAEQPMILKLDKQRNGKRMLAFIKFNPDRFRFYESTLEDMGGVQLQI